MDRFKYSGIYRRREGGLRTLAIVSVLLVLLFVSFMFIGLSQGSPLPEKRGSIVLAIETIGKTTTEEYRIAEIKLGELVGINHSMETNSFGFIECIDDVCSDSSYWWNISVSGKPATSSAGYKASSGDNILIGLQKK